MFRSLLRYLTRKWKAPRATPAVAARPSMKVEPLEDRWVPAVISGYAFHDVNGTGIYDASEPPIANSTIELLDSNNNLLATTTTDATGFYQFANNPSAPPQQLQETENATFASTSTDSVRNANIQQFDPSLGTLESVDIYNNGTLSSHIQVENQDPEATTVTGTVSGTLSLSLGAAAPMLNTTLTPTMESANVAAYDGTVGFTGASAHDFGLQTANGSANESLTAGTDDLSAFIGTGTFQVTETSDATSSTSGPGNLLSEIASTSTANVQVVYNYSAGPAAAGQLHRRTTERAARLYPRSGKYQ